VIELSRGALRRLASCRAFALDMDGTVYLGGRMLPGADRFLAGLAEQGIPSVFLTNNSSKRRSEYGDKLRRMGIPASDGDVMTSGEATIRFLKDRFPGERVRLVGTPSLEAEFREAGVGLAPRGEPAAVVVLGFDTTLTFDKLSDLCDRVRAGVLFVATHPDVNCPVEGGYIPDVGAFLALVEASTGRRPDWVIGKPGRLMVAALEERLGVPAADLAFVGDRLYTDVAMARESGMLAILVLSGETREADLPGASVRPDLVVDGLGELAELRDRIREHPGEGGGECEAGLPDC
jgi:HAD superfamily hydrolase (TIGR01450 family)